MHLVENYKNEFELDKKAIREGFGEGIVQVADTHKDAVVVNADLPGSLKLEKFMEKFPERYIQVGVAEQNMASIAVGLSHYGKMPFITSFAAFSPALNFAQIRTGVVGKQNIKIVSSHYGLNVGPDGASAQMESDIGMMKSLPNMVIVNPADYIQAITLTHLIAEHTGPAYMRLTREKFPVFFRLEADTEIGEAQKLLDGDKLTVIATGSMVYEALQAVLSLDLAESVDFLNVHTIKPLDVDAILTSAQKTGKVLVVEEHNIYGGLGEIVARVLAEHHPTKMKFIGIEDHFGESGSHRDLWTKYGLNWESIAEKIDVFIKS
jgi:transketolase